MSSIERRTLLKTGAAGVAAAAVGPAILGGCAKEKTTNGAAASVKVTLPTYVPATGPRPDLPSTPQGLPPGYKRFPKRLVQSVKSVPGDGSKVTALTEIWTTPPPPMGKNPFWQAVNKRLGVNLNLIMGTDPGYPDKFATIVAGGDLPDLIWIPPNQGITHVADLLQAKCSDLTPYLSGDAVKDYPNLAALHPTDVWKTAVVDGKIWGPPIPRDYFGQAYVGNKRWDEVGGLQCKNSAEFLSKSKELTRPKSNRWALEPFYVNAVHMFSAWYGVPNGWRLNKDGTLVNRFETDEYAEALAYGAKVFKAGCFYPNPNLTDSTTPFQQGAIAAIVASSPQGGLRTAADTGFSLKKRVLIPFGHNGGPGVFDFSYPTIGFTAIKKSSKPRVQMLLRILDYLAAPFGSTENEFISSGIKGQDFTLDAHGAPTPTKQGTLNVQGVTSGIETMSASSSILTDFLYPSDVDYLYGVYKQLLPIAQTDPTLGYYSDTYTKVGGKLTTDFYDFVSDAVSGRKPVTAIKEAVSRWKSGGGDTMRHEYEQAIGKHH